MAVPVSEGGAELDVAVASTKAPAWVSAAVAYFKSVSSSSKWVELVNEWVSFEAELSFPSAVRITIPLNPLGYVCDALPVHAAAGLYPLTRRSKRMVPW